MHHVLIRFRFEDLCREFDLVLRILLIVDLEVHVSYNLSNLRYLRTVLSVHSHKVACFDGWELVSNV